MIKILSLTFVLIMLAGTRAGAAPIDGTFSYQGRLTNSGAPVTGMADLTFSLWDAVAAGAQIGADIVLLNVPVSDGLFNVELDFGVDSFNGDERWFEIEARSPAGAGGYTTLSPRQQILGTPYSIQTRGIFVNDTSNVGIGNTAPQHPLSVGEPTADTQVITARVHSTTGPGAWRGAAAFGGATRSVIVGELGGVATIGGHNSDLSAWSKLTINPGGGNVGIGTANPLFTLHVVGNEERSISAHNTRTSALAFGVVGRCDSTTQGRGVFGWATATSGSSVGVESRSDSAGGFDFFAAGAGTDYGTTSSIRWKSNVRNIDRPLEKIARLRGVYYDWDEDHGGHHDLGMIAEEVGKVLPEIVNYEENDVDAIGMDYSKLTPLLVEAVNALRAEKDEQIDALRAENESLRARLESLENRLDAMALPHNGRN